MRLVHELRGEEIFFVVLGGRGPEVLRSDEVSVPEHLGTTDVDVPLITHVNPDADLGSVERALQRMSFDPDPDEDGWRWSGPVDGWTVKLEFLCDLPDHPQGEIIRPYGCATLSAANLRGTRYAASDFAWEELSGALPDGSQTVVRVRFAGLGGYLMSKCVAVRTRGAAKDYYDFAYVLLHSRAGGPEAAAQHLLNGELAGDLTPLRDNIPRGQSALLQADRHRAA